MLNGDICVCTKLDDKPSNSEEISVLNVTAWPTNQSFQNLAWEEHHGDIENSKGCPISFKIKDSK